jgi:P4 family phage/plasmid primase-like protien
MDNRLVAYLSKKQVFNKNEEYTHTSKIKPCGKYNIREQDLEEFYQVYNQVIEEGGIAGITEKPETIVPLIVDIDFRYSLDKGIRRYYKSTHIKEIIEVYQEIIEKIVKEPNEKMFYCCVLEKTGPSVYQGVCKDGFHLHFPYFYTEHWVQKEYIRNEAIKMIKSKKILEDIPLIEGLEKVIDKNIPSNTWLMYGSRKEIKSEPYLLTKRYNKDMELLQLKSVFKKKFNDAPLNWNLPRYLSIRGNYAATELKSNIVIKKEISKKNSKREYRRELEDILSDLIISEQLLEMLNEERANDYRQWMEIGWVLYNISEGHEKGLNLWIQFSMKSDKFKEGECEKLWEKIEIRDITLGTLKHFARNDAPSEFNSWKDVQINNLLQQGISMAHNDIAKILHIMFENRFICADVEKQIWYEFKGHRWIRDVKGFNLRSQLSHDLYNKYANLMREYSTKLTTEEDVIQKQIINSKILLISKLLDKLKNTTFKNSVMTEAMEYFYDKNFIDKMDENPYLLVCENGVYDSENKIFRDGRPEDYCTKTTGLYYHEFDEDDASIIELNNIFKKIFVNPKLFKFFKQTASDLIRGGNRHKVFVIWTGSGDNGKSVCADLLEKAFGDYYYTPPTTILTGKQGQSANATAEFLPCKGARVVVVSETDNADVLNCGTMKKLTGGDPFYARGLFKEPIKINPQFKLILHCNKLPNVSAEDKASWNRIRVLPYESTFVKGNTAPKDIQQQNNKKMFPMDKSLKDKLHDLAEPFLYWLIKEYEKFGDQDLYEPDEVTGATNVYHKTNDFYLQFLDERIIETKNNKDYITITLIYTLFKEWYKDSYPGRKIPSRIMVKESMEKKLGKQEKGVWKGFTTFDPDAILQDEEQPEKDN